MADLDDLCGRKLGEFVLRERLDEGGFGTVYRCEQPLLGREAVVKVLHQRMLRRDATLQRFVREAQLGSRLDHPYAAHVYALGVEPDDGLVWIAMELVRGVTLARWLQMNGTMPLDRFVPFFECVAEVVHTAHDRGIIHRDLKPSNMMVIERAGRLLPKLLDFGVARLVEEIAAPAWMDSFEAHADDVGAGALDSTPQLRRRSSQRPRPSVTPSSAVIGSPPYMAPEQWEGSAVGPAADLYALGIIAYEALTGARPFRGETAEELAALHRSAPVSPLGGNLASLDRLFQRALAKRPTDRFGSALEFAGALRAELETRMVARIRAAARLWDERARAPAHLWHGEVLAELERWLERSAKADTLGRIEFEFVEACQQRAVDQAEAAHRRARWRRRLGLGAAAAAVAGVFGAFQFRAAYQAETARQVARATAIESEVEQGRAALLHDDLLEAQQHLAEAVRRGDHSPATEFMLARASQPLRAEQARFAARAGRMWSATWSPDGTRIVTSDDSAAQIWDVAGHRLIATLLHSDTVHDAAYSPDGETVVTAGRDGTVRLWSARDGAPIRVLRPRAGAPRYFRLALAPGRVAAIDALGSIVHVWDVATGELVAELADVAHEWPTLAFSADGLWLATGSGDGVEVYETGRWVRATAIPGPIRSIAWDPAGPRLLTGATSGDASIWSVPTGVRAAHLREVGEAVDKVAWSPDGTLVATASRDGAVQVWTSAGRLVSQGNQVHDKIFALKFDRGSRLVAAAGANGAIAIGDAAMAMPISLLEGAAKVVMTVHFDPGGGRVLGASWDGTARVWDAGSPYRRWSAPPAADDCGIVGSIEADRRVIAIPCRDKPTRVWDTALGTLVAELPPSSVPPVVSVDGDRAAIARGARVELYELPGGRLLRSIEHGAPVTAIAFGAGSREILSGDAGGGVLVTPDGGDPLALPPSLGNQIDAVALTAAGRALVADARGRVRVIAGGLVVAELDAPGRIALLRPSPRGDRLVGVAPASAGAVQPVLWDLTSRRATRLEGNLGAVVAARWVAADRVLTAGLDGSARMWSGTGEMLVWYRGGRALDDADLSPDGEFVGGGGADGRLRYWEAATGRPLWTTPAHIGAVVGVGFMGEDLITRGLGGDLARWRVPAN